MCSPANTFKNITKSPTRTFTTLTTAGGSEIYRATIPGANKVGNLLDRKVDSMFGYGGNGGSGSPYAENPAQTLAQTGGAPLLANIALGASVDDTLAGYFGARSLPELIETASPEDKALLDNVRKQLMDIQSNTDLRNKAVANVVQDFPNIAKEAASTRMASGQQFDEATKAYLDQALNQNAAKYAAGGNISSGAMNEASAKTAAGLGLERLNYQDSREATAYDQGVQGWQARYNETNALRNFQNLMTGQAAGQGFSAVQASLNRNANVNTQNAGFAQQDKLQSEQSDNALFGAIGGLTGTVLAGPIGGAIAGQIGRSAGSGAATGGTNYQPISEPASNFSGNPRLNLASRY